MEKSELLHYQLLIEEAFPYPPPEVDLSFRRMFGGLGMYVRGRICAIVTNEGLGFKLDEYAQGELRGIWPEAQNISWTAKYLIAPPDVVADPALLTDWIQRCVDYVLSVPPKKRN